MLKTVIVIWGISIVACFAEISTIADTPHPRLLMTDSTLKDVRRKIASDPLAAQLHAAAIAEADLVMDRRTCRYDIPDGRRLLGESRYALNNIIHCAWAWRFTGERKYRDRALRELEAACSLKDWNPPHFLDVAEMATAVAIGYDWLYPTLSAEQRAMCEKAIIRNALLPAKERFDEAAWWTQAINNWAQVCGSGIGIAAAGIAGNDNGLSTELFPQCVDLVERCKHFYEPDGMYPEGPGYWHYGTNYHVMLIAACMELKHKMETPEAIGRSGDAMMHLTGPTLLPFNFSDGKASISTPSPAQCWIPSHYKKPTQANNVRSRFQRALAADQNPRPIRSAPLAILWLPDAPSADTHLPTSATFNGEQSAAIFRTSWSEDASWLAMKGGTPHGGHGHMDVGSFCYDAHGTRWIHDLGGDDYNMPGYFRSQRFLYYRLQNRSHNTLEIDGKLQDENSKPCPIIASKLDQNPANATFDLTNAYAKSADKVLRSVEFDQTTGVATITDQVTQATGDVVWRAFTRAECRIDDNRVILTKDAGGEPQSIILTRLSSNGVWSVEEATPPKKIENANTGYRAITLTVPKKKRISIEIEIRP